MDVITFLAILWIISLFAMLGGIVFWVVTKRRTLKFVLFSSGVCLACIIAVVVLAANEGSPKQSATSETEQKADVQEQIDVIVNAVEFAGLSEDELVKLLGEPESKEKWNYKSLNGQTYKAITYVYDNGNQEFLFIDGKVVRFTFYGSGQKYKDGKHALALFGIEPGPNITEVGNSSAALRYQRVHETMNIDEFWLIEDIGEDNTIGTVKITYDSRYF